MVRRLLLSLLVVAVTGCASRKASGPTAPEPQASAAPAPAGGGPSAEATDPAPAATVGADGVITIGGQVVSGPVEAVELLRDRLDDGSLVIADRSNGSEAVMVLVAELRRAGARRVEVVFLDESAPEPTPPGPPVAGSAAPAGEPPPPTTGSLPEIEIENFGLHIGGGPNDDAAKAPIKAAIARHFDELRACYRLVEHPEKGGTYGVDLRIPAEGGKAKLEAQRTGMAGVEFRKCVAEVFERVEFAKPPRGATVISYSVRFGLED